MALQASGLTAVRGERTLFSDLSFELSAGEALWVCGSNGSGKTTLLRMLCGLALPDQGQVSWRGSDIRHSRDTFSQALAYIGHDCAVKDGLSACENLMAASSLAGSALALADAQAALAQVGLGPQSTLPAQVLSQGQRKRAALARLLVAPARPVWVLDEPFSALDGPATSLLNATIAHHLSAGGILVYTTHQEPGFAGAAARRLELDAVAAC
ncbi:MAG TPA: cytochrome c biogenesis heme-transporting ATPase CcmA [Ramlibacter sp.]|nr:cytochrome c biogenesis heme-transporting ATPase CcmA [Ramlibacter sp.]